MDGSEKKSGQRSGRKFTASPAVILISFQCGRFREVYYWDSYFTMLGLKESGEIKTIRDMVSNFAYLIETYGHIPNGNRTYYLGRSQPPFFSCMVELLAGIQGDSIYQHFLPAMEKEYEFWMDGADKLKAGDAYRRVVRMKNGDLLNRYWDDSYGTPSGKLAGGFSYGRKIRKE